MPEFNSIFNGTRRIFIGEKLLVKEKESSKIHYPATLIGICDENRILIKWEWCGFSPHDQAVVELEWVLIDGRQREQVQNYDEDDINVYVPSNYDASGHYFPL